MPERPTHAPVDLVESLKRVRLGGIPLRAEQRLAEEAGPHARLFTSDLSVNEFMLVKRAGCQPIAQVMGSSIYHVGVVPDYKGKTSEITVISDGHRASRRAALDRLSQEARLLGADAVIGVHLRDRMITMGNRGKGGDDGGEVLEFTVVGTAVRAPWITHPPDRPVLTDLSGQDLWALYQDGYEPCGFVFEFCRYHVFHVTPQNMRADTELTSASEAVEKARSIAAERLQQQARAVHAEYVVGSDLTLTMHEVPCGFASCQLDDLDVDVSWFGTAIRRIPGTALPEHEVPPLLLSMVPIGHRHDLEIEAEDDADDIRIAAEDAEELGEEADEYQEEINEERREGSE